MDNVFQEIIEEYNERSISVSHVRVRAPEAPEAPGEFFYDSDTGKLYVAGADGEGELKWFAL
jgi:hypothetical protein